MVILTILHSSYYPVVAPSPVRFPMQRYSGRPASSTTVLTALEFARQPSANQRWPFSSPHAVPVGLGIPLNPCPLCLPFRPFPAVWLACKISPGKESRKASEGREKKSKFNKLKFKVMHSKIFQITRTRVDKDDYMNEDTLMQGDDSFSIIVPRLTTKNARYHIDNLVNNILPKGMFELVSDDTIRYNGGAAQWREEFVADIRSRAEAITPESVQEWIGPVYQLEKFLKNPLDTAYWFYMDEEALNPMPSSPTSSCGKYLNLNPARNSISVVFIDYHF